MQEDGYYPGLSPTAYTPNVAYGIGQWSPGRWKYENAVAAFIHAGDFTLQAETAFVAYELLGGDAKFGYNYAPALAQINSNKNSVYWATYYFTYSYEQCGECNFSSSTNPSQEGRYQLALWVYQQEMKPPGGW